MCARSGFNFEFANTRHSFTGVGASVSADLDNRAWRVFLIESAKSMFKSDAKE